MRATSKLLALALSAALQPALAGVVTLDFNDITSVSRLLNRYGDVKFTNNAWGVRVNDEDTGAVCSGPYLYVPLAKDVPNCGALLLGSTGGAGGSSQVNFTITSDFGFVDSVSFAFAVGASPNASIKILDEAGVSLASQLLRGDACEDGSPFVVCSWQSSSLLKFDGTARSIVFSSIDQKLMLDDLKLTTLEAPVRLPEPGSVALAFGALGALGWTRKRAAR